MAVEFSTVTACEPPAQALLLRHRRDGGYVDSYRTQISRVVTLSEFVEAFYTTLPCRMERGVLAVAVKRPSSDDDVRRLARGEADRFAAWTVEDRSLDQLLLCDFMGRTRSWLHVAPDSDGTWLYFGSAVVPHIDANGNPHLGRSYSALLGFHRLYSRVLLSAAGRRLRRAS